VPTRIRIVAIFVIVPALVVACSRLDLAAIGEALGSARLGYVTLALALNILARTVVRVWRTQALLGERVPFRALVGIQLAGYAAGTLLPGPAEEVACCAQLARRHGVPMRELVRLQLIDKTVSVVSVAITALVMLPLTVAGPLAVIVALVTALAPVHLRKLLCWLVVSNALSIALIGVCLVAVGVQPSPLEWVEMFLVTSVSGAIAVLPGQLGTLESSFAVVAAHHGGSPSLAIAAAVIYRITHAPTAIAGVPMLWRNSAPIPA
jgi:uncharacterized membrane protein YbhN (UPF0104 family)